VSIADPDAGRQSRMRTVKTGMRSNRIKQGCLTLLLAACGLAGCSSPPPPTTRQLAGDALAAMGGAVRLATVHSVTMTGGSGSRWQLGQTVRPDDPDMPATLQRVTETVDRATGRAAFDYDITTVDGFTQRRKEILTTWNGGRIGIEQAGDRAPEVMSPAGLFSWGTQNSPVTALRRNPIDVALATTHVDASQVAEDRDLNGRPVKFGRVTFGDETLGVYFDPQSHFLVAYETMDTEPILGDIAARYVLDDYRSVDGVMLPHRVTISKGAAPFAAVQFTSAAIDDAKALSVFTIPPMLAATAAQVAAGDDYTPLTLTAIGNGVYFAQAFSHHSLVVEFPAYLVVVEAPYTEAQSHTLVRLLASQFPTKPVRYAIVTHPHFDHIGGVRGIAAAGATILVARPHEAVIRALLTARHTNPEDELDSKRRAGAIVGGIQVYAGDTLISDGKQALELHMVSASSHADRMVIAYVPSAKVLFQSDLFFPATGSGASGLSAQLLQTVRALNLDVRTNAGGHGGVAPFDELVAAVDASNRNDRGLQANARR
jgi:glyoxylase-like metal-dependent hydrolase (beta-lactamase superfamily II)